MIVEITTGPGEVVEDVTTISNAIQALGHRVEFIEVQNLPRARDYDYKLRLRDVGRVQ